MSNSAPLQCALLVQEPKEFHVCENWVAIFGYANEEVWGLITARPPSYLQVLLLRGLYAKFCTKAMHTFPIICLNLKHQGGHFEICKLGRSGSGIDTRFESVYLSAKRKAYAKNGTFIQHSNDNSLYAC